MLKIVNGNNVITPVVLDGLKLTTEREGVCGKMTFDILMDGTDIQEGNNVIFQYGGYNVFHGFIFKRSTSDREKMNITAYDQLRYLKNKDTYNFQNKTASEILTSIAGDFGLQLGTVTDTKYKIASFIQKDKTLFDMIDDALGETTRNAGEMYVMYDNFGKLTLRNISELKVPVLITDNTAQSLSYQSDIDTDTYDVIKLYKENKEAGTRELYITKDSEHINKWGMLQYYGSIKDGENGQEKAEKLLTLYNTATKSLSIKNCFGDPRVHAGCLIPVILDVDTEKIKNYMLVEKCEHTFKDGQHYMDLKLRGGNINV